MLEMCMSHLSITIISEVSKSRKKEQKTKLGSKKSVHCRVEFRPLPQKAQQAIDCIQFIRITQKLEVENTIREINDG